MPETEMHIIYLRDGAVWLSRKNYTGWRQIQDEYQDYMASLGPWPEETVCDFLEEEYPDTLLNAREQVTAFIEGGAITAQLVYRE